MSGRFFLPIAAISLALAACERQLPTGALLAKAGGSSLGQPLPGLRTDERRLFDRGSAVFATVFTPQTGLGPLFNAASCAECHEDPVPGGRGDEVEVHATALQGTVCNDLSAVGGPVIQQLVTPALHDALGIDKEPVPALATATALRTSPSILGFGLLDAVPEAEILALADPNDVNGDGISGRPNMTPDGHVGRFGRKAQVATLREFTAGAFVMEMGITNPESAVEQTVGGAPLPAGVDPTPEPELSQADLDAADAFVRFLAPPAPPGITVERAASRQLFTQIGCAGCHVPYLKTGPNPVRALSNQSVPAFTDLLLHDMGPDLADICLGQALPSEFRTEPLMGLRFKSAFLHDGRATTIEQAIDFHGGEGQASRDRFAGLPAGERAAIMRFLRGL